MEKHESDIFILCADHRIHIWSAVKRQGLLIPERKFDKLSAFGAQIYMAYPNELPTEHAWLSHQLRFGHKTFPPTDGGKKRIVVVGHKKCGYYSNIPKRPNEEEECFDLLKSAEAIRQLFHGDVEVEAYYAVRKNEHEIFLETLLGSTVAA